MHSPQSLTLHATSVAVAGEAVLILGASGSGKSALALELMARGARLVADDQVILTRDGNGITVSCPEPLRGMIEARGVGILHADPAETASLVLIVDMDQTETKRMPPERETTILDCKLPLLHNVASQHFPAAIIQYVKSMGRRADHPDAVEDK